MSEVGGSVAFPEDSLRRLLQYLVRTGGLLEPASTSTPHEHGGVRTSLSELFALGALDEGGPLSQQDLAAQLGLEKSTVSRLAAGMAERGWLVRERDPANRRFYRLTLTRAGRDAARRVGADLRVHHARLLAHLTAAEREALGIGLDALVRAMDTHLREVHGAHGRQDDGAGLT